MLLRPGLQLYCPTYCCQDKGNGFSTAEIIAGGKKKGIKRKKRKKKKKKERGRKRP